MTSFQTSVEAGCNRFPRCIVCQRTDAIHVLCLALLLVVLDRGYLFVWSTAKNHDPRHQPVYLFTEGDEGFSLVEWVQEHNFCF